MPIESTNLDYLIPELRQMLGDTDSSSYRYTDPWLMTALVASVKALMAYWNFKYLIDTNNNVKRNANHTYIFDSPPIVQYGDEMPIKIMAAIIVKEGSLEESSWNLGAWRDAEISFSNIQGGRTKEGSLERFIQMLHAYVTPPNQRLAQTKKQSLPGFKNNPYEYEGDY